MFIQYNAKPILSYSCSLEIFVTNPILNQIDKSAEYLNLQELLCVKMQIHFSILIFPFLFFRTNIYIQLIYSKFDFRNFWDYKCESTTNRSTSEHQIQSAESAVYNSDYVLVVQMFVLIHLNDWTNKSFPCRDYSPFPYIVQILNIYTMLSCTNLSYFFPVSIHSMQCFHCLLQF